MKMRESLYYGAVWTALASIAAADAPSAQQWAEKSIYQIMTDRFARSKGSSDAACDPFKYCGGSWAGIIDKLDYIQDLGFTAIQISPVVENIPDDTKYGEAFHGYWPRNLYALNEHFGTDGDLRSLASELHKRDMYLMVDVVINDMAQAINGSMDARPQPKIDYSKLIPFDDKKYYHSYCNISDWSDAAIYQNCWFGSEVVALPDLKTEDKEVQTMIQTWVKELVSNYSIDGLRIDATKHMDDEYVTSFSKAAGVFTLGEVYTEDPDYVCKYEEMVTGLLNYPVYQPSIQAFTAGNMPQLAESVKTMKKKCPDFTRLATFIENHDIPRFASLVNDTTLAKNAMAFNILADGIPIIYQGQEQHLDGNFAPYNREALWTTNYATNGPMYNVTAKLNKLRNHAISIDNHYVSNHSIELYLDQSTYATRKGPDGVQIVSVFSNQGSKGGKYDLTLKDAFAPNTEVMEILGCSKLTANSAGNITVKMGAGEPKVFFPTSHLDGSGLCGYKVQETKSTSDNTTDSDEDKDEENVASVAGIPFSMLLSGAVLAAIFSRVF